MKRREILQVLPGLIATTLYPVEKIIGKGMEDRNAIERFYFYLSQPNDSPGFNEQRVPFGWKAFSLSPAGKGRILKINRKIKIQPGHNYYLRLTIAIDIREEKTVEVMDPATREVFGEIDIRYAPVLNMFELPLTADQISQVQQNGIILRLAKGTEPLWIFEQTGNKKEGMALLPHLLAASGAKGSTENFLEQLLSTNTLQPLGWMEGCVLDACWQLYQQRNIQPARKALDRHLSYYFTGGTLIYEDARSKPADNRITTIEFTLPFALLARVQPDHPALDLAIEFWKTHTNSEGLVLDGDMVSAEGSYTIAYPMAMLGSVRNDQELLNAAVEQLRLRKIYLKDQEDNYYLRHHFNNNRKTFYFWARGMAWYMLGLARTLPILNGKMDVSDLIDEFKNVADVVRNMQRTDGLWSVFLPDQSLDADTSGSSGIAAALATGVSDGFLPDKFKYNAEMTWQGLQAYLTPDGFLKGAAQSNRGGIALQESNYRVISQMGMGLMGQLYAELE